MECENSLRYTAKQSLIEEEEVGGGERGRGGVEGEEDEEEEEKERNKQKERKRPSLTETESGRWLSLLRSVAVNSKR